MSALGYPRLFDDAPVTSGLSRQTDISNDCQRVSNLPESAPLKKEAAN